MPIFKCSICRIDIERSRELFIKRKGYLLCSLCLDKLLKKENSSNREKIKKLNHETLFSIYLRKG